MKQADLIDLRRASVISPPDLSGPEQKAIAMLVEEVEKRTQIRWPIVTRRVAKKAERRTSVSRYSSARAAQQNPTIAARRRAARDTRCA